MRRIWARTRTIRPGPWPYSRPRALVEHTDQPTALRYVATLRRAGYSAGICPGPAEDAEPRERCVLTMGEPCQFVEGSDVVVSALGAATADRRAVLEALRRHHPAKPLVVVVSLDELHLFGNLLDGVHVVVDPVEPYELLAAVHDAVETRAGLPAAG